VTGFLLPQIRPELFLLTLRINKDDDEAVVGCAAVLPQNLGAFFVGEDVGGMFAVGVAKHVLELEFPFDGVVGDFYDLFVQLFLVDFGRGFGF
jgi:hypothetical protein